jgi:hypothetical protein
MNTRGIIVVEVGSWGKEYTKSSKGSDWLPPSPHEPISFTHLLAEVLGH